MPVPFGGHPPRGVAEGPGGDDQRRAIAGQHLAEDLDGPAVRVGGALEVAGEGDVVLEGEVDHAVRGGRRVPQDVEVVKGAALHLRPGRGQGLGRGV